MMQNLTAFEQWVLLPALRDLNRRAGPVPARLVADFTGLAERTARYYLARLEQRAEVARPYGPRSGWVARFSA